MLFAANAPPWVDVPAQPDLRRALSHPVVIAATILAACAGYVACGKQRETTPLAPTVILQTQQIVTEGEQNFSVSLDGHWILFVAELTDDGPRFQLVDVSSGRVETPAIEPDAGNTLLLDVGVWAGDSTRVFVRGSHQSVFVLDVTSAPRLFRRTDPRHVPAAAPSRLPVLVRQLSKREAQIVDAEDPTRVLARHRAEGLLRGEIAVGYIVAAPDGRYVTYTTGTRLGGFAAGLSAYLLRVGDATGWPLSDTVLGPVKFDGSRSRVYGLQKTAAADYQFVSWRLPS